LPNDNDENVDNLKRPHHTPRGANNDSRDVLYFTVVLCYRIFQTAKRPSRRQK